MHALKLGNGLPGREADKQIIGVLPDARSEMQGARY